MKKDPIAIESARIRAIRAIRRLGITVPSEALASTVAQKAREKIMPRKSGEDLARYLNRVADAIGESDYKGEIVKRYMPDLLHRKPYREPEHPNPRAHNLSLSRQVSMSSKTYRSVPEFLR